MANLHPGVVIKDDTVQFWMGLNPTFLSVDDIIRFIKKGRTKVLGTRLDPYAGLVNPDKRIKKDAKIIFTWFTKQPEGMALYEAYMNILAIQRGPRR